MRNRKDTLKVNVSLTDSPFLNGFDYLFKGIKTTGADGLEIVTGLKSRFHFAKLQSLAEKHGLTIDSAHQPIWSGLPYYFDLDFVKAATAIGVKKFVFHPLPNYSFDDTTMRTYFAKLAKLQEKYGITVMLENMPSHIRPAILEKIYKYHSDTITFSKIYKIAEEYDFHLTLDISHAYVVEPEKEAWFDIIFPRIANIHLSSFNDSVDHLPLHLGKFKSELFLEALKKRKYQGLITFEIFYPKALSLRGYDFASIKKSVDIVKKV